ncbi:hypothetical protein N7540_008128 [Penicillium herquei]|nr:hypothetical protein N7540_008128 [Penicillium herquei]
MKTSQKGHGVVSIVQSNKRKTAERNRVRAGRYSQSRSRTSDRSHLGWENDNQLIPLEKEDLDKEGVEGIARLSQSISSRVKGKERHG